MIHHHSLLSITPQKQYRYGSRIDLKADIFPALHGLSLSLLTLKQSGFREPHWHPNADELGYCLKGRGLYTVFSPGAGHDTFTIEAGQLAFVPMGYLHSIENIGSEDLVLLVCFDNEQAEDLELSSSVASMPDRASAATVQMDPGFFKGLTKSIDPVFIGHRTSMTPLLDSYQTNRFKLDVASIMPQVQTAGGWVRITNGALLPTLQGMTAYVLGLEPEGLREPHWHPNAAELNYLISGTARITLLSPGGHLETFDMEAGDASFLPQGYFHYIDNTGKDKALFVVFFNHIFPSDLGLSGCLGAYPNDLLADLFKVKPSYFDKMPKHQHDLFVVKGAG